jgi:uncharacterized membrane protein AbrB (regulator of aidB expression)
MYTVQIYIGEAVGISEFSTLDDVTSYLDTLPEGVDDIVVLDAEGNDIIPLPA